MSTDNHEAKTLAEGLADELDRNRELLQEYREVGPAGKFGAMMIEQDIAKAERARLEGDVVAMLRCYTTLKGNQ